MVLSAFPLVHPRGRLWRQPQLSCQRLYSLRLFFRRRGNFAAKNRPARPRRGDLAMGGLVFPHFSDRLLPAYCVRGSLFLALVLGSILAAISNRWWLAGVLGALAWMTRANGIILLPTLAVEAIHQWIITKRWNWRWLWIAIVPAGFAVYLFMNWKVTGDPFAFLQ